MADTVIGALRVALGLDTAAFDDGMNKSSAAVKSFGRDVAAVAAGIELQKVVEKVVESFTHLIKESINLADEMGKLSQKVGVPVEQLSGLSVAAKLADVEVQTFAKGMARLSKEVVAAAAGGVNEAASAFQYLGLSAKQLVQLSPDQALGKISDAIAKLPDGMNKTAVATAIFGQRLGANLIPLLNAGSHGFEEMMNTAAALGVMISTTTAKQAEKFNDNVKLMGLAVQGVGLSVASYFLPGMAKASESMVKWVVDGNYVSKTAEVIVRSFLFVRDNAVVLGSVLILVFGPQIISAVAAVGMAIVNLGIAMAVGAAQSILFAARFAIVGATALLVGAAVLAATGNLDGFLKGVEDMAKNASIEGLAATFKAALAGMGLNVDAFNVKIEGLTQGAKDFQKSIKDAMSGNNFDPKAAENAKKLSDEIAKITLRAREARGEFDLLAPGAVAAAQKLGIIKDNVSNLDVALLLANPKFAALNAAFLQLQAANMADPFTKITQSLTTLNAALTVQGTAGFQNWELAARQAIGNIGKQMETLSNDLIGGWTSLTGELGKNNKKMFALNQALAIVQATMSTFAGATKALEVYGPTPIGFAAMAAAIAAGLARVISIKQQKYTGAAAGGTFKVPGGLSNVDTKMINMALAPGELVEVTPAGKASGGGSGYLEIPEINPQSFFTGDVVRHMVLSIDKWMRDGGTGIKMVPR